MNYQTIINKTALFVKNKFLEEKSGHGWDHIYRVWHLSKSISEKEDLNEKDSFFTEIIALLHDINDWKLKDDKNFSDNNLNYWLIEMDFSKQDILTIKNTIECISFKGESIKSTPPNISGMIVQDSDRIDAIGAIGIARTFYYGGAKGHIIFDPTIKPNNYKSFDEYKRKNSTIINHFYEKLLLLYDSLNLGSSKIIAEKRNKFLNDFLSHFLQEWSLNDIG